MLAVGSLVAVLLAVVASVTLAAGVPAPIITSHPALVDAGRTATFKYYDTMRQPIFACSLDNASPRALVPCWNGMWSNQYVHASQTYTSVCKGKHTFRLIVATGRTGPASKTVTFTWTIK